jgi:hypothetical protein
VLYVVGCNYNIVEFLLLSEVRSQDFGEIKTQEGITFLYCGIPDDGNRCK